MARFTGSLSGYGLIINFVKNPIFVSVDRGCSYGQQNLRAAFQGYEHFTGYGFWRSKTLRAFKNVTHESA